MKKNCFLLVKDLCKWKKSCTFALDMISHASR